MKKFLAALMSFVMLLSTLLPLSAFASNSSEEDISTCGTLSGYGQIWHDPSVQGTSGQFDIVVSGASWINAHTTITFEDFNPNTKIRIWFWGPTTNSAGERQLLYKSYDSETVGDWEFKDQMFNPGKIGTYTIQYEIVENNCPGRINCWIF